MAAAGRRARSGSITGRLARAREKKREGVVAAGARRTTEVGSGRRDGARSGGNDVVDEEKTTATVRARSGAVGKEKKELCPL